MLPGLQRHHTRLSLLLLFWMGTLKLPIRLHIVLPLHDMSLLVMMGRKPRNRIPVFQLGSLIPLVCPPFLWITASLHPLIFHLVECLWKMTQLCVLQKVMQLREATASIIPWLACFIGVFNAMDVVFIQLLDLGTRPKCKRYSWTFDVVPILIKMMAVGLMLFPRLLFLWQERRLWSLQYLLCCHG